MRKPTHPDPSHRALPMLPTAVTPEQLRRVTGGGKTPPPPNVIERDDQL